MVKHARRASRRTTLYRFTTYQSAVLYARLHFRLADREMAVTQLN